MLVHLHNAFDFPPKMDAQIRSATIGNKTPKTARFYTLQSPILFKLYSSRLSSLFSVKHYSMIISFLHRSTAVWFNLLSRLRDRLILLNVTREGKVKSKNSLIKRKEKQKKETVSIASSVILVLLMLLRRSTLP